MRAAAVGEDARAGGAGAFVLINHTFFLLAEEPGLERRFGQSYRVYRAHVPRWIPRLRPWRENERAPGEPPVSERTVRDH